MADERKRAGAYDLHMHSTFSDGSQTVRELIAEARAAGLARIAITDHDCLKQLSRVREIARELSYPVLAATEVSCTDRETGRKIHILAYGLEATVDGSGPLERIVDETLARRTSNTLWQAWTIMRAGVTFEGRTVTLDDVVATAGESTAVYKQHVMQALTGLGYRDERYRPCYQGLFKNGGIAERDIAYPDAEDAVRAVREQGGVPVLAHPQQMDSWDAVPRLVKAGLRGIEAFHPDNEPWATAQVFELSERYGLMCTGGSDYHGTYGAPQQVGACFITPQEAGTAVDGLFDREKTLK